MPVSPDALIAAGGEGVIAIEDGAKHHLMSEDDVLRPLADVVPVPPPFGLVLSIGDVLLYAGMAWWCFNVTRGRFRENIRPPARHLLMYRGKHAPFSYRLPGRYRAAASGVPVEASQGMWDRDPDRRYLIGTSEDPVDRAIDPRSPEYWS
jgi:hypothetical protein